MIRDQEKGLTGFVQPGGINDRQTEVLKCARKESMSQEGGNGKICA
jgi:hypothetical protein